MGIKRITKKEQESLLLAETKKRLQKELSYFKRRKILTPDELNTMKEDSLKWDKRFSARSKTNRFISFTPLEELELKFWHERRRVNTIKVEHMIYNYKRGSYDQSIEELQHFGIDVRHLLREIKNFKGERDGFHKQVHELLNDNIEANKEIGELQTKIIKLLEESLGIPEKNHLTIVT
jgi:hypothetical protein